MSEILFTHPLHAGLLLNTNGEKRLLSIELSIESSIFRKLDECISKGGFDYFYYNDILMIPDVGTSPLIALSPITECQIEGMKDYWVPFYEWILFLTIKEFNDELLLVQSLNLPHKETVRKKLKCRDRRDFRLIKLNEEDSKIYSYYSDCLRLHKKNR